MTPEEIKKKIQEAEESVSSMQDPALKKAAFEVILSRLLGNMNTGNQTVSKKENKKNQKIIRRRSSSQKEEHNSTINLNVAQLDQLKNFYDEYEPSGTEAAVFTLAHFADEKLKIMKFHDADIDSLYHKLLSVRPKTKPPIMSLVDIQRALRWLTAPSRRKQWLDSDDAAMFSISASGKHHIAYDAKKNNKEK